jgi:hypothetical protein
MTTSDRGSEPEVTWQGNSSRNGARVLVRDHEERDDAAGTIHLWGEVSSDGKSYVKKYDLTCRK